MVIRVDNKIKFFVIRVVKVIWCVVMFGLMLLWEVLMVCSMFGIFNCLKYCDSV